MSVTDISTLKNTLRAQQQLLQGLYNELDAERDSSASAVSEVLSAILRLQEEKAAIKMESDQYKRLAEEKMRHAEESMAITEDIIFQKEMEVSALNYQVQAYYHKLLSMGCVEPAIGDIRYHHENISQRNGALASDKIVPVLPKFKKVMNEHESNSPEMDCVDKIVEKENGDEIYDKSSDLDKKSNKSAYGSTNSYWEQIKKLEERVQEIDQNKRPSNLLKNGSAVDYHCSTNIYDVFEVPQIDRKLGSHESLTEGKNESDCCEKRERDHAVHPAAVKFYAKDEFDGLKKLLRKHSDIAAIDCHFAVSEPSTSGSANQPRLNQLEREPEIIEVERPAEVTNREEEMKLLNEIKEQLNLLQDEIRDSKVKKPPARDDSSLCLLSEAMIYFWL